jgi:NAD(P)-dependent dehydrogenase (short-subunit alcohol dehydrogenase family)
MTKGWNLSLEGKVALVTGGARGIGAETCRQLASAGADIIINHSHSSRGRIAAGKLEKELAELGVGIMLWEADVSKEQEVIHMVAQAIARFGHIDILVNNAGVCATAKFEEMTYQQWQAGLDVILNGTFLVTRYVIPHMLARHEGSIIMITSNATINGGGGGAHYPAAKAGMEGMAKQLVKEYAACGIRVNVIQPAVIDTDMLRERYPTDEEVQAYGKKIPVGRVGQPVDVANAVVFLASDKAGYICGASLLVDGGRAFYSTPK